MIEHASQRRWLQSPAIGIVPAIALQLISNGRWIIPIAAWLAPIAWLLVLRRSRSLRVLLPAFLAFLSVQLVAWRPIIPTPGTIYVLIVGTYSVAYFLPYALHRVLAGKLSGIMATLVYPTAWVAIEFVFHRWVTPYGSWFSLAYTQTDYQPLLQFAALTGIAGISFMITWFAAVAARALDGSRPAAERVRTATVYGLVLLGVLVHGQLRLRGGEPGDEPIRVAGLVPSTGLTTELETALAPVRGGRQVSEAEVTAIASTAERLNDDLFIRTIREARCGARLVAWSETAGRVLRSAEEGLLERARRVAASEGVDLVLAYGVWLPGAQPPFENKVVAVSAAGEIAWEYRKAHPIAGAESSIIDAGDGVVRRLATSFGALGAVICHDLDFAPLMRQANREAIGLIVAPSADWPAITPLHANMAVLRSIESGFSLFRPTSHGRSIAVDSFGRTLAAVDYADDAMVAYIRPKPVRTVYGSVGDLFAWLNLGGLLGLAGLSFSKRPSEPDQTAMRRSG